MINKLTVHLLYILGIKHIININSTQIVLHFSYVPLNVTMNSECTDQILNFDHVPEK